MKKRVGILLGVAVALGLLAGVLSGGETLKGLGEALMALGTGLRGLSLAGGWRGALSWAIYALLGLAPLAGLMPVRRRHTAADALWFVSSAYAFFMLYALVNPFILKDVIAPAWAWEGGNALLALSLASPLVMLLLAGFCLRVTGETERETVRLLTLIEAVDVFLIAAALPGELIAVVQSENAVWQETRYTLNGYGLIAALCALARLVFALGLCESGKRLNETLGRGWLHDDNEAAARRVAVWARGLLAAVLLTGAVENAAQIFMGARLNELRFSITVPAAELTMALAAVLLARFVQAGVRVRRENDSFI